MRLHVLVLALLAGACGSTTDGPRDRGADEPTDAPTAVTPPGTSPSVLPERQATPGRVTLHRLNRAEYDNTVRDLLGTPLRRTQQASGPHVSALESQCRTSVCMSSTAKHCLQHSHVGTHVRCSASAPQAQGMLCRRGTAP